MDEEHSYRALLNWLYYSEMNDRRDMIKEAHGRTFGWIFETDSATENGNETAPDRGLAEESRPAIDFIPWLRNQGGIYWIHGKPGAGKSTMMKYLADDERLLEHGAIWAAFASCELVVASFYFYKSKSSSPLQQSLCGLYRALLWQLIREDPSLARYMFPHWQPCLASTEPRLVEVAAALRRLATANEVAKRFIFLIDGLDEYEHDDTLRQDELAKDMLKLVEKGFVKMIIASRPETAFRSFFGRYPNLPLHELTEFDIKQFVEDELGKNDSIRPVGEELSSQESLQLEWLVQIVVRKAEGVFLWARVVVDFAVARIQEYVPFASLLEDVFKLNPDLEMLFGQILARIKGFDKIKQTEGLSYLRLTLQWIYCLHKGASRVVHAENTLTLGILGIACEMYGQVLSEGKLTRLVLEQERKSVADWIQYQRQIEARVKICCLGLLEVHYMYLPNVRRRHAFPMRSVRPMHRALAEYLNLNKASLEPSGNRHDGSKSYDCNIALMSGLLATAHNRAIPFCGHCTLFFEMNARAEISTDSAQVSLLSAFEHFMSSRWPDIWQNRTRRSFGANVYEDAGRFQKSFKVEPRWENHAIQHTHENLPWVRVVDPWLPDTLALSIHHGGWLYLRFCVERLRERHGTVVTPESPREYWSGLLIYALFDLNSSLRHDPNLEALQVLLSSGACPNTTLNGLSVWQLVLDALLIASRDEAKHPESWLHFRHSDKSPYDIIDILMSHGARLYAHSTYAQPFKYRKPKDGTQVEHVLVELRRFSPYQILSRRLDRIYCCSGDQEAIKCRCDLCLPLLNSAESTLQNLRGKCDRPPTELGWDEVVRAMHLIDYRVSWIGQRFGQNISVSRCLPNETPPQGDERADCEWGPYQWIRVNSNKAFELLECLQEVEFDCSRLEPSDSGNPARIGSDTHGEYTIAGWIDLGEFSLTSAPPMFHED